MKRMLCLLLCLLTFSALAETVQDQALSFFQSAGIEADSVMRVSDEIIVILPSGGTAALACPDDYDVYNLAWRFFGAADEEVAAYLDYALSLLAELEARIPSAPATPAEEARARSYAQVVESGLQALESVGQQGLDILQAAMEKSGGADMLDVLRVRLAEQIMNGMGDADTEVR